MKFLKTLQPFLLALIALSGLITLSNCNRDDDDEPENSPNAAFTFSVEGQTTTFTFTGSNATSYSWDFGDGETSMDESPVHTYSSGGTYSVVLTVENVSGTDTESQDVVIEEAATAETPELSLGDADGAFYAINTVSVQEAFGLESTIKLGTALAWFVDEGTSFVSVGDVEVENSNINATLDPQSNDAYVFVETQIPSEGFSNQGVTWSITGGSGHSSVNGLANLLPFPSTKRVDESASDISRAAAYTLEHEGAINNADSSIFAVHGPDGSVMKTVAGTTTSVSFSAAEMGSVGRGAGILQIASFSILSQTVGGKKYYMINESVANKNVNIN